MCGWQVADLDEAHVLSRLPTIVSRLLLVALPELMPHDATEQRRALSRRLQALADSGEQLREMALQAFRPSGLW